MSGMLLQMENVTRTFAKNGRPITALRGANLKLDKGEYAALRGPSGCGKSTALMIAGALLRPDSGSIRVNGADVYGLNPEQRAALRARSIGFVFQQFHLIPYLNVIENISAPSLALKTDRVRERAVELAAQFDLSDRAGHYPSELSAGECQRAALARALFNRPQLLLADEPTGNLDAKNAVQVLSSLRGFAEQGGAVLLVTHDPLAAGYSSRVLEMQDGTILESN